MAKSRRVLVLLLLTQLALLYFQSTTSKARVLRRSRSWLANPFRLSIARARQEADWARVRLYRFLYSDPATPNRPSQYYQTQFKTSPVKTYNQIQHTNNYSYRTKQQNQGDVTNTNVLRSYAKVTERPAQYRQISSQHQLQNNQTQLKVFDVQKHNEVQDSSLETSTESSAEENRPKRKTKEKKKTKARTSGRLLGRPDPVKCARRPKSVLDKSSGHYYFFSVDTKYKNARVTWLEARNLCREQCMDLVSIETPAENQMIQDLIRQRNLHDVWTSGRLCNFKGCDQPHLQPRHINGWFWSATGISIAPTDKTPPGWARRPWSHTGFLGQFVENPIPQPDNAEYKINPSLATFEACLSVNNNWYDDGIVWHDSACYKKKPFMCEDNEVLMKRARSLNPNIDLLRKK